MRRAPFLDDPDAVLYQGDALEVLRELPDESVDCAATSPPFYGLRDYQCEGQIGLEATPEEWCSRLVDVFREVRRVLTPTATLWVEIGDSYSHGGNGSRDPERWPKQSRNDHRVAHAKKLAFTKPKDLIMQPFLLAEGLREDGWYLRQIIIWEKPNAMPESIRDRCTTSHSYVLLLSKKPRYFFDAEAISGPAEWARWGDQTTPKHAGTETAAGWIEPRTRKQIESQFLLSGRSGNGQRERTDELRGFDERRDRADGRKNARSVWTIPTKGFSGAHFATWPEKLVERIILAGCPERVCATCGKASERQVEKTLSGGAHGIHRPTVPREGGLATNSRSDKFSRDGFVGGQSYSTETVGFSDCGHDNWRPGVILDPFMGSGTTALVARKHGRRSVGIELNPEYLRMAERRLLGSVRDEADPATVVEENVQLGLEAA